MPQSRFAEPHRHLRSILLLPPIVGLLLPIQALRAQSPTPRQELDSICQEHCKYLVVDGEVIQYVNQYPPAKTTVLGNYVKTGSDLVPRQEAPIVDLRTEKGWRMVVSLYLDHGAGNVLTRVSLFRPGGYLSASEEGLGLVDAATIHQFFPGDDVVGVTATEQHGDGPQTTLWFLPDQGDPKAVLKFAGTVKGWVLGTPTQAASVEIERQTYDGVHPETKGLKPQLYIWDKESKTLNLPK